MKSIAQAWLAASDGRPVVAVARAAPAAGVLAPQGQPLQAVEAVDPLDVDRPALAAQQDVEPAVAVADPAGGQLAEPQPQGLLRLAAGTVVVGRSGEVRWPAQARRTLTP